MKEFPREGWIDSVYTTWGAVLLEPAPSDALAARGAGFIWKIMPISTLHYQIWESYGGFIQVSIIYGMVSYKYDQTTMISWYLVCVDHWDINMLSLQCVDSGSVDHYLNLDY